MPSSSVMCPHCHVGLPPEWTPSRAGRCPTCRLIIGAHRASTAGDTPRNEMRGSAAGVLANAARRADVTPGDPEEIRDALHAAAIDGSESVARLRMIDYDTFAHGRPGRPTLATVLATFGTWKNARARAATHHAPVAGSPRGRADASEPLSRRG